MLDQRNTAKGRPDRAALAKTQPAAQPQCSCGGYVRKTLDAIYQDHYYQCVNCGREYSQFPTKPLTTPEPAPKPDVDTPPAPGDAVPHDPFLPVEPPHAQELLTAMRWPHGVKCPSCRSSKVRTISPPPQTGFACDACHQYFDHRTKTLLESYRVTDEAWIDLIERTVAFREAPTQHEITSLTLLNLSQARRLRHDIIRAFPHPDSTPPQSEAEFRRLLIESWQTPASQAESAPTSSIIGLQQPALPIMDQNQNPAHILASLRWPQGIPCPNCSEHDFSYAGSPTQGEYICRNCNRSVNLRRHNILTNTNHGLRTWINALRVLFTSPHTLDADELQQLADIAPFPAQSITERFQRILPLWTHTPSRDITVEAVSQFLNIPLPSQRGRYARQQTQPSDTSESTPDIGELSQMSTANIPVPRVMPEYLAKRPATADIANMRWPHGLHCPFCKSYDCMNMNITKSPQPFQCRSCRRYFSTRTASVLAVNSIHAKFWIPLIRHVATHPDLPDAQLASTISGAEVRQTERMLSAIADVMERWTHEPSPDVDEDQIAELLNIKLSREHPVKPGKPHQKQSRARPKKPTVPPVATSTDESVPEPAADSTAQQNTVDDSGQATNGDPTVPTPDTHVPEQEPITDTSEQPTDTIVLEQQDTNQPAHEPTQEVPAIEIAPDNAEHEATPAEPEQEPAPNLSDHENTPVDSAPETVPDDTDHELSRDATPHQPVPDTQQQDQRDIDESTQEMAHTTEEQDLSTLPQVLNPNHPSEAETTTAPPLIQPTPETPAPTESTDQGVHHPDDPAPDPDAAATLPTAPKPPSEQTDFEERLSRVEAQLAELLPAPASLTVALQPPATAPAPTPEPATPNQQRSKSLNIPGIHEHFQNRKPPHRCGPHHATS